MPVVDPLEVVEVEQDQGELASVAVDLGHLVVQVVDEGAVVVEPREPVGEGRGGELSLGVTMPSLDAAEEEARDEEQGGAEQRLTHHTRESPARRS